jgi:hypothetical protein
VYVYGAKKGVQDRLLKKFLSHNYTLWGFVLLSGFFCSRRERKELFRVNQQPGRAHAQSQRSRQAQTCRTREAIILKTLQGQ